jgi:hypothetical protein
MRRGTTVDITVLQNRFTIESKGVLVVLVVDATRLDGVTISYHRCTATAHTGVGTNIVVDATFIGERIVRGGVTVSEGPSNGLRISASAGFQVSVTATETKFRQVMVLDLISSMAISAIGIGVIATRTSNLESIAIIATYTVGQREIVDVIMFFPRTVKVRVRSNQLVARVNGVSVIVYAAAFGILDLCLILNPLHTALGTFVCPNNVRNTIFIRVALTLFIPGTTVGVVVHISFLTASTTSELQVSVVAESFYVLGITVGVTVVVC